MLRIVRNYKNRTTIIEMLYKNQLQIADEYDISNGNIKKLVRNVFEKEKYVFHFKSLQLLMVK